VFKYLSGRAASRGRLPSAPMIQSNLDKKHIMNKPWNYVLPRKVNHFLSALSCLLLLSLALATKFQADSLARCYDKILEQNGQPLSNLPASLPETVRPYINSPVFI
jgi:hypothetical protein